MKQDGGPTAIETRLGWVLSGPAEGFHQETVINFTSASSNHMLRVYSDTDLDDLDAGLKRFWELESLGILKEEHPVQQQFSQKISFKGGRYEVHLPWKDSHPPLPDNYDLCRKRLDGVLKRLRQDPEKLHQYNTVIQDQLRLGVVEIVSEPYERSGKRLHYHIMAYLVKKNRHGVSREEKQTTKLRVVYDGSAKTNGPSLNECLHTGPNFGQHILQILLRFWTHRVADIEKAFLMVSIADKDRDVLRFLWVTDVDKADLDRAVYWFTRVVFGVSASPFLLNATIDHHMKKMDLSEEMFVQKFRRFIYVDDVATSLVDVDAAYQFYQKAKLHLAKASFNLRKFATSSPELHRKVAEDELRSHRSIVQSSSNDSEQEPAVQQVLGINWDVKNDLLIFDVSDIAHLIKAAEPTKRNAISLATKFYDPLGVISPVTVKFKQLFQKLCEKQLDWDEPLTEQLLTEWESLTSDLQQFTHSEYLGAIHVLWTTSHMCSEASVMPPRRHMLLSSTYKPEKMVRSVGSQWKQFIMNRVIEIRSLVPPSCWRHCPGTQNPADIPSRGVSSQELQDKMTLWLHGPSIPTMDAFVEMVTPPRWNVSLR